jgi:hypothetical protein
MEVADNFVRLDRSLAHFLDALERRFGDRVLVALTADHGVQSNPEIVKLRDPKADVGRLDLRTPDPNAALIATFRRCASRSSATWPAASTSPSTKTLRSRIRWCSSSKSRASG